MTVFLFLWLYRVFATACNIDGLSFNRNELNVDDLMGRQEHSFMPVQIHQPK